MIPGMHRYCSSFSYPLIGLKSKMLSFVLKLKGTYSKLASKWLQYDPRNGYSATSTAVCDLTPNGTLVIKEQFMGLILYPSSCCKFVTSNIDITDHKFF